MKRDSRDKASDRGGRGATSSRGLPRISSNLQKLEQRQGLNSPAEASGKNQCFRRLDFRLPASRPVRG